jgi:hypothetical protein
MRRLLIPALFVAMGCTGIQAASGAVYRGGAGPDRLTGTAQADELYGHGGRDRLEGRGAGDLLDGGNGPDRLSGSAGNDRLASSGDGRIDAVLCGTGRDLVVSELRDRVAADCEVVSRQLSRDADRSNEAQHETQVEPDSFAFGSTVVAVFQSGRFAEGGAVNIGFATSRNGGRTWRSGRLPGLTIFSSPPGRSFAVSDPVIAYDAVHRWWLATSLGGGVEVSELLVNRSRDGLTWNLPVTAARTEMDSYDKEWIACDNSARSPLRGRCYLSYMNFTRGLMETRHSTDGGRTWSTPVGVNVRRPPAIVNGVQPVIRPNGDLVIVFSVFGARVPGVSEIAAVRSTDGGESFLAPVRVAGLEDSELSGLRAPPFASVEVDRAGTIYASWSDCRFSQQCAADIVLTRSGNGVTWSEPTRVPTGVADGSVDYFLPGLAVDPATSGRTTGIAVLYHVLGPARSCDPRYGCLVVDVGLTISRDAGATWTRPQQLNAVSMSPLWLADTALGRMLGDYVSVSWVGGRAVPVFSLATEPTGGLFHQAIFATTRLPAAR